MKIPFVDLGIQYKQLKPQIISRLDKICKKGHFILGEEVKQFEQEFAAYCRTKYAIGLNSGTDALFLSLISLGISRADEVIVPAFTFIAPALAVSHAQAKPVFVDIDEQTFNIDVSLIERAITKRTRAIIVVHLFGHPVDMAPIIRIAHKYGLKIIEDAAQAHGAEYKISTNTVKRIGSIGDVGCFSFYPTKNLGGFGDGGMIVMNSKRLFKHLLMLRDSGRSTHYKHIIKGYNSRLDNLQAAVLRLKLKSLDKCNQMRRENALVYTELLQGNPNLVCPYEASYAKHIYHVYAVRVKKNRDSLRQYLTKNNIGTLIHYPIPLHLQRAYRELGYKHGDFPVSEKISGQIISLPMHPFLKHNQMKYISQKISHFL